MFVVFLFWVGWLVVGSGAIFLGLKSFFLAFAFKEKVIEADLGLEVRKRGYILFMLFEAALLGNLT